MTKGEYGRDIPSYGSLGPQASEASIAALVKESVESEFPAMENGIREKNLPKRQVSPG